MSEHLHRQLAALHQSLLHGKLPRNLHWAEALELIRHLGDVEPTGGDEFAFLVGTQRAIFKKPHTSELGVEEASRLRRLLKAAADESPAAETAQLCRMVAVIDHHAARVFRDLGGSPPREEAKIEPYDPHHFHRHLIHRKEGQMKGERVPEDPSFYAAVAEALVPADEVVLIGHGTGKSSAVDALVRYLQEHRSEISRRVTAIENVDLSALTEPGIEAIAKQHMNGKPG